MHSLSYWLNAHAVPPEWGDNPITPLERRILVAAALQKTRVWLAQNHAYVPSAGEAASIIQLLQRRSDGEPIAYILQEREFYNLPFYLTPAVLIPRPETELLIELALTCTSEQAQKKIMDLGTGSGCIALSIAKACPQSLVYGVDRSPAALQIAAINRQRLNIDNVILVCSDWFSALSPDQSTDLIVSNPPYIDGGDSHLTQGDLRYEPKEALSPGLNGLSALEHIIAQAPSYLARQGWLLLEHGYLQGPAVRQLLAQSSWQKIATHADLPGLPRVTVGQRA